MLHTTLRKDVIFLEQTPLAQLSKEKLDEINALADKLGVILIAYDSSADPRSISTDKQPDVINPS